MQPARANEQKKSKNILIIYFINLILTIMKKSLFFVAAASALMLTACSSENDVVQNAPQTQETTAKALDFDVYTSDAANVTRAGYGGVMTTEKLKINSPATVGFGVFAMYQNDGAPYAVDGFTPNFMFNEHVTWSGGWTYSPLKYWPNETTADMLNQTGHASSAATDKLSFFAYAPYVNLTTSGDMLAAADAKAYVDNASGATGIIAINKENWQHDPLVKWKVSANPDNNVDLLWGVAPAGLSYTAVNGATVNTTAGKAIVDMIKPDKDQKIKFLFKHALSRIGMTVVSAIDQVADGGNLDNNTRVLIDNVVIYGNFGTEGILNLNNTTADQALWTNVTRTPSTAGSPLFTIDGTNGYLAPSLRYVGSQITAVGSDIDAFDAVNAGVLPREQTLMVGGADPSKKVTDPTYAFGTILYKYQNPDYVVAKAKTANDAVVYEKDGSDNYTQVYAGTGSGYEVDGSKQYYTLAVTTSGTVAEGGTYYAVSGTTYTKQTAALGGQTLDATNVTLVATPVTATYTSGDYYTSLSPRYFMVIPSDVTPTPTEINVKITYHVVTKDAKLTGKVSDVTNAITKTANIQLVNGKSYNLKLILGLTSVKLDATVEDWQLADETELNLPKNN